MGAGNPKRYTHTCLPSLTLSIEGLYMTLRRYIPLGSCPRPGVCRVVNDQVVRDALRAVLSGCPSDIDIHLLPCARPPGPRLRDPRLNTVATSATADLIGGVMGLDVRSIAPRRVTANSIAREAGNGEKLPDPHPGYPEW